MFVRFFFEQNEHRTMKFFSNKHRTFTTKQEIFGSVRVGPRSESGCSEFERERLAFFQAAAARTWNSLHCRSGYEQCSFVFLFVKYVRSFIQGRKNVQSRIETRKWVNSLTDRFQKSGCLYFLVQQLILVHSIKQQFLWTNELCLASFVVVEMDQNHHQLAEIFHKHFSIYRILCCLWGVLFVFHSKCNEFWVIDSLQGIHRSICVCISLHFFLF